jgi:hypothetical protein
MYSRTATGIYKEHIAYVGNEESTESTNSSLPAWDKKFEVVVSLFSTLFMINPKWSTLGLVVSIGNPR